MSYEIIYDKNFLKVEDEGVEKFVPFVLTGSNNCYDMYNRRSRSWWNWTYFTNGDGFATLETMLAKTQSERVEQMERERDEEYSDKSWGYYTALSFGGGCRATFGQYEGIFKTGCRKAVTVEQLLEYSGGYVSVSSGYYDSEKLEKFGKKPFSHSVKTSEELVAKYREAEKFLEGTDLAPRIELGGGEDVGKTIRRRLFKKPQAEKKRIEVDHCFVVKDFTNGNYIVKATRNGYSYSSYGKDYAKKFRLESEAKRYAKKLYGKYVGRTFVVEPIEKETHFYI